MTAAPEFLDLGPFSRARGVVRLPGSKSISNRTLLLAALAHGSTEIHDLLASDDTDRMLEALAALGVTVERVGPGSVRVHGCGGALPTKTATLFLGNAGTALRPLTAVLALGDGRYRLSGVPRMHERPIGDLVGCLRSLGADILYLDREGFPPLEIRPASLRAGERVAVRGDVSSQFLTALLMALPLTGTETTVEVVGELISKPYIDLTIASMARFGVQVRRDDRHRSFTIPAGGGYESPGMVFVEGDASAASYFSRGGDRRRTGAGRGQVVAPASGRCAVRRRAGGPRGAHRDRRAPGSRRGAQRTAGCGAFDLDLNHIPDAAMVLAVVANPRRRHQSAAQHRELAGEGRIALPPWPPSCARSAQAWKRGYRLRSW